MIRKHPDEVDVRVALVFPDVYEVGMSYMGFPMLYHILNQQSWIYAERAFSPWTDMERLMREQQVPLLSLETFTPLSHFDILGFTFQYELHYTTMLNLIDLAGLPLRAQDREGFPLVVGGGPSVFNPEPVAEFFDALVIGDAEEAVVEVAHVVREAKLERASRLETLQRLAKLPGIYVPQFYKDVYDDDGRFVELRPVDDQLPKRIRARTISDLRPESYPDKPLVPVIQTTHDRISLEIARGCSRGCRFCNAGMIYRPVRQRSPEELVRQAKQNIEATGYEEISLVSLSTSDYTRLPELMQSLHHEFAGQQVNISFPSLRPESFTPQVAQFAKGVRKSGLTLAPEAGTQRLRDVINKATTATELLRAVDLAFREGWNVVKLYFMIGHPTETDDDLIGLVDLIRQVREVAKQYTGKRLNVSVSPFIPKPVTPFQWVGQDSREETRRKLELLSRHIRWRNVKLSWREPEVAYVEGLLARGDRRVGRVLERVWRDGATLEGWSEFFEFSRYDRAMRNEGLAFESFVAGYDLDQPLPWQHIDKGVTHKFLRDEYARALGEEKVPDCRFSECHSCGLMGEHICKTRIRAQQEGGVLETPVEQSEAEWHFTQPSESSPEPRNKRYARIHYSRGVPVRFLSHLDVLRIFERALRRARIPVVFTEGFNPHPKLAFGPSLATGLTSDVEYLDVQYYEEPNAEIDLAARLAPQLPEGMRILNVQEMPRKGTAIAALIGHMDYEFIFNGETRQLKLADRVNAILSQQQLNVERKKKNRSTLVDVRPFIDTLKAHENGLFLRTTVLNGKSVRHDEILSLLFPEDERRQKTTRVHRKAVWVREGATLKSPMDILELSENSQE